MKRITILTILLALIMTTGFSEGASLLNPSFEIEFGARADRNMWGDFGETFGECYQVQADGKQHPPEARDGDRVLLINIPPNTWNGIWQQTPWEGGKPFSFTAYYMIQDGDLVGDAATFLKVEFFDENDNKLGELVGDQRTGDTGGKWVPDSLQGEAPPNTASLRLVIIGGHNPEGPPIENRIYWDDADLIGN